MTDKKTIDGIDYTRIDWSDVQAGDVLMHENGDRVTVQGFEGLQIRTTAGLYMPSEYEGSGFSPYRRVPDVNAVPTKLGAYLDKDGDVWELEAEDTWALAGSEHIHRSRTIAYLAPFTPLVPMPTKQEVEDALYAHSCSYSPGDGWGDFADAVMALFEQEADSE